MKEKKKAPKLFVIGSSIATLTSIAAWLLAPVEARFISNLTDNPALVGVTYAVGTTAFVILSLFLGRVADNHGREKMIITGLSIGVIYPLLYASAINIFTYMGIELLWAMAAVGTGPVLMSYLQDLVQDHPNKSHLMSLMYGAMSLSGAVGHLTGGFVGELLGLSGPYYFVAGIYLFILVLTIPILLGSSSASKSKVSDKEEVEEFEHLDASSIFFGIRYVFQKPVLIFYFIVNLGLSICYRVKLLLWPLIVVTMIETPIVMGVIFAGTGVVAFITLLFSGRYVDSFGPYPGVHIAFVALILGGFSMALTDSYILFGIGAAVFAVGEAFWGSVQTPILIDNVDSRHRSEILGVDQIFDRGFTTVFLLISGSLMVVWSAQSVWFLFMGVLTMTYITAHIYKKRRAAFFS